MYQLVQSHYSTVSLLIQCVSFDVGQLLTSEVLRRATERPSQLLDAEVSVVIKVGEIVLRECLYACGLGLRSFKHRTLSASGLRSWRLQSSFTLIKCPDETREKWQVRQVS